MEDHRRQINIVLVFMTGLTLVCGQLCKNCVSNCTEETGICSGYCSPGWDGLTCSRRNVAFKQNTTQSSDYENYPSSFAVDGSTGHLLSKTKCSHTLAHPQPAFWTVTLDAQYKVYRFRIYNRVGNNCRGQSCGNPVGLRGDPRSSAGCRQAIPRGGRLNGFTLSVGNFSSQSYEVCYQDNTTDPSGPGAIIYGVCNSGPVIGDIVRIMINNSQPLTLCEVQIFVCTKGTYGQNCSDRCGNCAEGKSVCDTTSGHCPQKTPTCMLGYLPPKCDTVCSNGSYGPDCEKKCGNCAERPLVCNTTSGHCPQRTPTCMPGYSPPKCDTVCTNGTYGPDCGEGCGNCADGPLVCDTTSGHCPQGRPTCMPGYLPPKCDKGRLCENCVSNCAKETGICSGNCSLGWDGPTCSRRNVAFKQNTTQSSDYQTYPSSFAVDGRTGHLLSKTTCSHTQAHPQPAFWTVTLDAQYNIYRFRIYNRVENNCLGQCGGRLNGFTLSVGNTSSQSYKVCYQDNTTDPEGPGAIIYRVCNSGSILGDIVKIMINNSKSLTLCEVQIFVCTNGTYGPECEERCGNCAEGPSVCDTISGHCPQKRPRCMPGYLPPKCDKVCSNGTYGLDCVEICGNCSDGLSVCDTTSGHCPNGTEVCMPGYLPPKCDKDCNPGTYGSDCEMKCGHCIEGESVCDARVGHCPDRTPRCMAGYSGVTCDTVKAPYVNPGHIGGGVAAAVVLIVIIAVVVVIIFRRRRRETRKPDARDFQAEGDMHVFQPPVGQPQDNNIVFEGEEDSDNLDHQPQSDVDPYVNADVVLTVVSADEFPDYVLRRNAGKGFKKEFEAFPVGLHANHTAADKPKNKEKSRYRSLVAYDHSRVMLSMTNDQDTDYINACYINGYNEPKKYIASQGPNDVILKDFLRMIWEQKSGKIVMVTNLVETTKTKCYQYWPDEGSESFGLITVTLLDEEVYADFTVRTLQLTHMKRKNDNYAVKQFHFTSWPDHGAPAHPTALLDFRDKVNTYQTQLGGPIVVHCSAGVGRTGTYIALDYLITQAQNEGVVDVPTCVRQLREQRVNMVQTLEQYNFLHEALAEALKLRSFSVPAAEFPRVFAELSTPDPETGMTKMAEQFQSLQRLTSPVDKALLTAARHPDNVSKNRSNRILAADTCRPYLSTPVPDGNNYINAVYLTGFKSKRGFVITQTPLPSTVLDFWRLVYDHGLSVIVMIDVVKPSDTDVGIYWPTEGSQFDPFVVKVKDKQEWKGFSVWTYHLSHKDTKATHPIKQFRCKFWSGSPTPSSIPSVVAVIEEATRWQQKAGNEPVLVHCRDGVTKCGLYCAATTVVERLKVDQEVNIVNTVKQMRTNRPEVITDQDQFHFLHQVARGYLETAHTYANFV